VAREVDGPTLVLGSTQPVEVVARAAVAARGVDVVRRRGGGGSVYLEPGSQLWFDAWIPRDDPLWTVDVTVASTWAGEWWMAALGALGLDGFETHRGRAAPGELGELVCFAGRGPGEVFHQGRKVTGLSQWRSREGALFSTCAYWRWDPAPLIDLLGVEGPVRAGMRRDLPASVVGVGDLRGGDGSGLDRLRDELATSFPTWSATPAPPPV
jgi:lipoate---protein ligase